VTLDLEKEYREGVIDYMIAEYSAGRTPNPDVMCNREVKFGAFWKWAEEQGADFIATGHYARNEKGHLLTGKDANKDQSYFLWTLNQNDLKHVLFPVGGIEKPEVRKLAKKFKLPNADKKDSQGLCFIGKVDVKEFLAHYAKGNPVSMPGTVLNEKGGTVGTHPGSLFFTIGERHGFTIAPDKKTPDDATLFVVSKDIQNNTITVSDRKSGLNSLIEVAISNTNWANGTTPKIGAELRARSRYRQPLQGIKIKSVRDSSSVIEFKAPQDTLTPGQSLVIYDGEECLGGGIIS